MYVHVCKYGTAQLKLDLVLIAKFMRILYISLGVTRIQFACSVHAHVYVCLLEYMIAAG